MVIVIQNYHHISIFIMYIYIYIYNYFGICFHPLIFGTCGIPSAKQCHVQGKLVQRLQHLARARRSEEAELVASQLPWQKLSSQEWDFTSYQLGPVDGWQRDA